MLSPEGAGEPPIALAVNGLPGGAGEPGNWTAAETDIHTSLKLLVMTPHFTHYLYMLLTWLTKAEVWLSRV